MKKSMIGAIIAGVLVLGGAAGTFICIERIPAGYVGVQYSMNGGVQDEILPQGWHLISPTKKVTEYSVATEQLYMQRDEKKDNSFDVIARDGKMNVDFEMSYSFDADKVPDLYSRYRGMSGEDIINNIVIGKIKTLVNEVTSQYSVLEAHMEKKGELNRAITEHLKKSLAEFGVVVESANLTQTRVDSTIEAAITERSKAAQELEAEKQKKEKAIVEAERKKVEAQGEADAQLIKAQGEARANEELQKSITSEMVEYKKIEKWDGKLPTVSGSDAIIDMRGNSAE
jgi:regulator of protease activity HflC (stomatin/prohibitin superfamily)